MPPASPGCGAHRHRRRRRRRRSPTRSTRRSGRRPTADWAPAGRTGVHQIGRTGCRRVGDRGASGLAADRAGQAQFGHQPLHGAAGHRDALAVEREPHFAGAVDPVVVRVDPLDLRLEGLVADLAAAGLPAMVRARSRSMGRSARRARSAGCRSARHPTADHQGLAVALMIGDEPSDQWCGRSSSAAKKADAVFKIALARRSSAFSRFSRFSSADSSVVSPGRWPASTCGLAHPLAHRLRASRPRALRDRADRRPLRLVLGR